MRGPHDPLARPFARAAYALAFASFFAAVAGGCDGCGERKAKPPATREAGSAKAAGSHAHADASALRPLRLKPRSMDELPTTAADIYFGNLDGQIEEITRLLKEHAGDAGVKEHGGAPPISHLRLASSFHYTRGRFRGDLDEIALAIAILDKCVTAEPDTPDCYVMRAEQEQSLHRFPETRADLDRAKKRGVDAARVADLETELDYNGGRYDVAIKAIREARLKRPSTGSWMREAQLEHDLGNDDKVDAAFEAAEDLIVDTNPLPVAHLNVQRGIVKAHAGRIEDAIVFFREAVVRIPDYIAANEHLAEALHQLGQDEEATKIYEGIVKQSDDPEFMHALASLYNAHGKPEKARELETKATSRYEALLKKYPEAMYWHASEFYLDTGNAAKAVELLRKNIALRPNGLSYAALARAELENKQLPEAKASIDKALAMPLKSADLFFTASKIYEAIGDAAAAASYLAKAKALNPRIAKP